MARPDVLVIGLGAMGSATLYQLAKRGVNVLGIDQYSPPHAFGSTHGESRITREAVGEGAAFVPLAMRSHVLWREIEREAGVNLLNQCGGLILARADGDSHMHAQRDFLGNTIRLALQFCIAHEVLSAGEIQSRYPQLQLTGDETGYFEPGAGFLLPEACVQAQLHLARTLGADVNVGERVQAIILEGKRAIVDTDLARYAPDITIVCAGPWLPELLAEKISHPLVVRRQTLHWFGAENPRDYAAERFPIFIWHWGSNEDDVFYGIPDLGTGVKIASEQTVESTTPEAVVREVDPVESTLLHARHIAGRLRGITNHVVKTATCLYTNTPDANFLIDRLPNAHGVIVVSACSGHGFKHSAAIGEAVAEMTIAGAAPAVLRPFAIT
jgi:sarcosine oxidase